MKNSLFIALKLCLLYHEIGLKLNYWALTLSIHFSVFLCFVMQLQFIGQIEPALCFILIFWDSTPLNFNICYWLESRCWNLNLNIYSGSVVESGDTFVSWIWILKWGCWLLSYLLLLIPRIYVCRSTSVQSIDDVNPICGWRKFFSECFY